MNPSNPMMMTPIPVTFKVILNSSFEGFLVILNTLLDSMKKDFNLASRFIKKSSKMGFINVIVLRGGQEPAEYVLDAPTHR